MNLLTDEEMVKVMWNIAQLLTDDEVCKITQFDRFRAIAKAQAVKLIKWLDEPCTEHPCTIWTYQTHYIYHDDAFFKHRKDCPDCWNKLKQEAE